MIVSVSKNNTDFTKKTVMSLYSLASLMERYNYSMGNFKNNYRNLDNFLGADFIALDFDGGLNLDQAKVLFEDYAHIISPTRNHRKEKNGVFCDRFRVVLKLSERISDHRTYKSTVKTLLDQFPAADKACSDASRMFYPGGKCLSVNVEGNTITPVVPAPKETPLPPSNLAVKGKLSRATLDFIERGAKSGVWNHVLFKAAVDCMEQNYTLEECLVTLKPATRFDQGDFDEADLKTVDSAFNRDPKHPPRLKETVYNLKTIKEIQESKQKIKWLVDGLLTDGGMSIIAGAPKSGKSTITRQLARAVSRGEKFLNRKTTKGTVIYLALEEQEALLKEQYKALGIDETDNILVHVGPVNGAFVEDDLQTVIEQHEAKLVVIDTFLLLAQFENLNDYRDVYKVVSNYRNIARQTGAHIACLHHQNKGENKGANSILGSTAIQGAVDCSIVINQESGRRELRRINSWQRGGKPLSDFYVRFDETTQSYYEDLDGGL